MGNICSSLSYGGGCADEVMAVVEDEQFQSTISSGGDRRSSTRSYQQRDVRRDYSKVLVHAQLWHELKNLLVLKRHGVVVVELDVGLLHLLTVDEGAHLD